ncbi:MAG: hypothetical protein WD904_09905 [Dehalococcoidia bacterium]
MVRWLFLVAPLILVFPSKCQDDYIPVTLESGELTLNLRNSATRWIPCLVTLLCLFVVALACNGDDGDDTADREEQRALLEAIILTETDVPETMFEVSHAFSTNEQAAEGAEDPAAELEQFETWGRQLGLSASYVLSPGSGAATFLGVQSDANVYDDDQGCHRSYEHDVSAAREADWTTAFSQITDVEVTELDASNIGDEAYWLRVTGTTIDAPKSLMAIDQVVIRVGRVRAFLRADSRYPVDAVRDASQGQVETWAQLVENRIRQGLGG